MVMSPPPDATMDPSFDIVSERFLSVWPRSTLKATPFDISHTRTDISTLPDAATVPSPDYTYREYCRRMTPQVFDQSSGACLPNVHDSSITARNKSSPISRKLHIVDFTFPVAQLSRYTPTCPQSQSSIITCRCHKFPIFSNTYCPNFIAVGIQGVKQMPTPCVPDLYNVISFPTFPFHCNKSTVCG
mmetsp:Transcript_16432/g.27121  ORF Transcript_16432/g.27121 Transcript_16432/m.27121 type:complete len:187 (+) Transcript_16432:418-978(+)